MDIHFQCKSCQTWLMVDAVLEGRTVECWQCKKQQVVTQVAQGNVYAPMPAKPVGNGAPYTLPPQQYRQPREASRGWIGWLSLAVVGLLFIGFTIFAFRSLFVPAEEQAAALEQIENSQRGTAQYLVEDNDRRRSSSGRSSSRAASSTPVDPPKKRDPMLLAPGNRATSSEAAGDTSKSLESRSDKKTENRGGAGNRGTDRPSSSGVKPDRSSQENGAQEKGTQEKEDATPESPTWGNSPASDDEEKGDGPTWGGANSKLAIPARSERDFVLGPLGCPVVIVKDEVWHIETKRAVSTLEREYEGNRDKALSQNGQRFVAFEKSRDYDDADLITFDTVTGKQLATIPIDGEKRPRQVTFSRSNYVMLAYDTDGDVKAHFQVYDATTGKLLSTVETKARRIDTTSKFTPDGKYFTGLVDDRLVVMGTKSEKIAATMAAPKLVHPDIESLNRVQRSSYVRRSISAIRVLEFAPDATELAAVSTANRSPRLLCWNQNGKLVQDSFVPQLAHKFFFDPAIAWFPDKSGWIISGGVFDRKANRLVMVIMPGFADDPLFRPLDRNRILGRFPHDPDVLQVIEIPWAKINASLELMESDAPAILTPKRPVGLTFELKGGRNAAATEDVLREAFIQRLGYEGITVTHEPAETTFNLRLSEKAGEQLPIFEKNSPFDFRGRDTGRKATEVKGELAVELVHDGKVVWRDFLKEGSSRSFDGPINDATVRKSMVDNITKNLDELAIPYFIPKSQEHHSLPVYLR